MHYDQSGQDENIASTEATRVFVCVAEDATMADDRRCHMPCHVQGCNGRCPKAYGHGGVHECDQNASH